MRMDVIGSHIPRICEKTWYMEVETAADVCRIYSLIERSIMAYIIIVLSYCYQLKETERQYIFLY